MKKISVSVSYDEEKLSTLRLYLEQKGMQVEDVAFYLEISEDDVRNIENEMKKAE